MSSYFWKAKRPGSDIWEAVDMIDMSSYYIVGFKDREYHESECQIMSQNEYLLTKDNNMLHRNKFIRSITKNIR